ncbi:MAG TPA: hypothetical protein ENN38_07520 [Actinobacteria bacterium]|nr:hypothetical protein [Actinomycetota bacterium]
MKYIFEREFDKDNNIMKIGGKAAIGHCQYYNTLILKTMESFGYVDGLKIFEEVAEDVNKESLEKYLKKHPEVKNLKDKISVAEDMYRTLGFGLIEFSDVGEEGAKVIAPVSHFALTWKKRWGKRSSPSCYFTKGYIAGVISVIFDKPLGSYEVKEFDCISMGDRICRFEVRRI